MKHISFKELALFQAGSIPSRSIAAKQMLPFRKTEKAQVLRLKLDDAHLTFRLCNLGLPIRASTLDND